MNSVKEDDWLVMRHSFGRDWRSVFEVIDLTKRTGVAVIGGHRRGRGSFIAQVFLDQVIEERKQYLSTLCSHL